MELEKLITFGYSKLKTKNYLIMKGKLAMPFLLLICLSFLQLSGQDKKPAITRQIIPNGKLWVPQ